MRSTSCACSFFVTACPTAATRRSMPVLGQLVAEVAHQRGDLPRRDTPSARRADHALERTPLLIVEDAVRVRHEVRPLDDGLEQGHRHRIEAGRHRRVLHRPRAVRRRRQRQDGERLGRVEQSPGNRRRPRHTRQKMDADVLVHGVRASIPEAARLLRRGWREIERERASRIRDAATDLDRLPGRRQLVRADDGVDDRVLRRVAQDEARVDRRRHHHRGNRHVRRRYEQRLRDPGERRALRRLDAQRCSCRGRAPACSRPAPSSSSTRPAGKHAVPDAW